MAGSLEENGILVLAKNKTACIGHNGRMAICLLCDRCEELVAGLQRKWTLPLHMGVDVVLPNEE